MVDSCNLRPADKGFLHLSVASRYLFVCGDRFIAADRNNGGIMNNGISARYHIGFKGYICAVIANRGAEHSVINLNTLAICRIALLIQ